MCVSGGLEPFLEQLQVGGDGVEQQAEAVPDDVHSLLRLQTLAALRLHQQLHRELLQAAHTALRVPQLLLDLLHTHRHHSLTN